ncbi:hypothetical protein ACI797_27230 [Geodermatophilus sp. SYSU D00691]
MLRAQFTYTASRRAGAWGEGAGWKVQSVVDAPGAEPVAADAVRQAARSLGGFVPPRLPELPTRADVDALPHRLRLDLLEKPLACVSHVVAAGADYSGRPNFFAHGLVLDLGVEEADERGFLRPADLWDADFWLRPLGAKEVEASDPDAGQRGLRRGPLDDAGLERFTRDHPNQQDFVLAAFERCVMEGSSLVIVGDASESVAQWLRLIGLLVLPASAWRLPFSTFERLSDAATAARWPFTVVGVPAADAGTAAGLPGARFVVLRDDGPPAAAGLGRWTLQDRSELVTGRWAQLAGTVVLAGLLPDVARQIDDLAVECSSSAVEKPLWALGAAVLLLEDLPFDELAGDAAELAVEHWPDGLELGRRTTETLLRRMIGQLGENRVSKVILDLASAGGAAALAIELVQLNPIKEALASPTAFARLEHTLPQKVSVLHPAAAAELDEVLGEALGWVELAGDDAPRALLRIAALMQGRAGVAADRANAVDLARELLVPELLDSTGDPLTLGWPLMPAWLWDQLMPYLVPAVQEGRRDPGRELSEATHCWLSELGVPRGELTVEALRTTGPANWERAAFRVFQERPRPTDITPLERAAAFLAAMHSSAVKEDEPKEHWANAAARYAYPPKKHPMRAAEAAVLRQVLPPDIPLTVEDVVARPDLVSALRAGEAVAGLPVAGGASPWTEETAGGERASEPAAAVLVTEPREIARLAGAAMQFDDDPTKWGPVAEAMLRMDTGMLPVRNLASFTWDPRMPWNQGWQDLKAQHDDPAHRLLLAAHLICRGARAEVYRGHDQAERWLTTPDGRGRLRYENAAVELLASTRASATLVERVEQVTRAIPQQQNPAASYGRSSADQDERWRSQAVNAARRVVERLSGSTARPRAPRWNARGPQT